MADANGQGLDLAHVGTGGVVFLLDLLVANEGVGTLISRELESTMS